MSELLCMSMGGSIILLFYFLLKITRKEKFTLRARWSYLIAAIIFFIFPYPKERAFCFEFLYKPPFRPVFTVINNAVLEHSRKYFYKITDRSDQILYWMDVRIFITIAIILVGFIVIFVRQYWLTLKLKNEFITYGEEKEGRIFFGKRIRVIDSKRVVSPIAVGVIKPMIVIPVDKLEEKEREIAIRHELQHIRSGDMFLNVLSVVLISLHWFNPVIYYMVRELKLLQELKCDEKVTEQMNDEEREMYICLLLRFAKERALHGGTLISALSGSGKRLTERVNRIMENNYRKGRFGLITAAVLAGSIFLSSLTALAYAPPVDFEIGSESGVEEAAEEWQASTFYESGVSPYQTSIDELIGQDINVFQDEKGLVYYDKEAEGDRQRAIFECKHDYVDGTMSMHEEKGATGCKVTTWRARRCSKCFRTIRYEQISEFTYATCPH